MHKDVKLAEKLYRLNIWRFVCLRDQHPGTLIDPDGRISISWAIRPVEKIFANAVAKAGSKTAAKAAPCAADGPLPVGEIISGIWTLYDIYQFARHAQSRKNDILSQQPSANSAACFF